MRITIHIEEDEPVPCVCKVRPILTAFAGADLHITSTTPGKLLRDALKRANIHVNEGEESEHGER